MQKLGHLQSWSNPEHSRTCKSWDISNPEAIPDLQNLGHLQSQSNPEQYRTCKNWDTCTCNPGAIPSNPGPARIGAFAISEQSQAIPDLQKLGHLQSRSNPGPAKSGTSAIPEQSPDLQKLRHLQSWRNPTIAAIAKNSSFRCPEVGTKFDGQNRPPSRYLHCPADVQHIYLYVDAYIYIYIYTCVSVYEDILISNITKHLPVSS